MLFMPQWVFYSALDYLAFVQCICALSLWLYELQARVLFTNSWILAWYQVKVELNVFQELSKSGRKWAEDLCSFPQNVCLTVGSWNWSLKSFSFPEKSSQARCALPYQSPLPNNLLSPRSLTDPNSVDWLWQYVIEHRAFSLHCD